MKVFIVLSVLACAVSGSPLIYARLVPGAPIGLDGRVVDTPEVTLAKAEHAAAHINERINLAHEAVKSADQHVISYVAPGAILGTSELVQPVALATKLVPGAPIGLDGRVVDTPEVALAKAEHAAAHINERLGHQAARLSSYDPTVVLGHAAPLDPFYII